MAKFKKYLFEKLFDMGTGYVYNFDDVTFHSFIEESVGIDIDSPKYRTNGTSKAKRLRTFWKIEDNYTVGKLLKDMLDYFESTHTKVLDFGEHKLLQECKIEVDNLLSGAESYTDKLTLIDPSSDITIKELKISLETDLNNRRFNAALDRLHTYCVKYFRTIANELGILTDDKRPLHSVAGEVIKVINAHLSEMTFKILRSSLSVLDAFNTIRNEKSLAHDNVILENSESKLIVEWILNLLFFFEECYDSYKKTLVVDTEMEDDIPF
jgi:hypothetical protein